MKKLKTILVTGGAGFIGSHLCEELIKSKNYKVISLDNYSTGSTNNHVDGVQYVCGNTKDVEMLINVSPDIVYHLGEYSRVEQSFSDIRLVHEYNRVGTFELLEFCKKNGCKIIYAGSSTKFGDGGLGRNQSPYAWSKASNTELVMNYGNWYNLPFAITYFYNAYGPREISFGKYATLIGLFRERMKQGKPLTVVLPGTQKRNFTHVKDIVSGLVLVGEKGHGDEFGIGSQKSYNIIDIVNLFGGGVEFLPERQGNRLTAEVITNKTTALGWREKQSLEIFINKLRENNWEF